MCETNNFLDVFVHPILIPLVFIMLENESHSFYTAVNGLLR